MISREELVREVAALENRWAARHAELRAYIEALVAATNPRLTEIEEKLRAIVLPTEEQHFLPPQKIQEIANLLGQLRVLQHELTRLQSALLARIAASS